MYGYLWMTTEGKYLAIHDKTWPVLYMQAVAVTSIHAAYVGVRIPHGVRGIESVGPLIPIPAFSVSCRKVALAASLEEAQTAFETQSGKLKQIIEGISHDGKTDGAAPPASDAQ